MKKAQSDPMKFLIGAIIIILVAFIVLYLYNHWFSSAGKTGDGIIKGIQTDCDQDGLTDTVDPCICENKAGCEGWKQKMASPTCSCDNT